MSSETNHEPEVAPIKHARLTGPTELTCPACSARLGHYEVYGIEIEGCAACRGVFTDKGELRKLKDKADSDSWRTLRWMDDEVEAIENSRARPSGRSCPKCPDTQMVSVVFGDSDVTIDWCPACQGLWLEKDEFGAVLQHLRDKLTDMTAGQAADEVMQEIKDLWSGPENKLSELLDVKAAIGALLNITIFEHPLLFKMCMKAQQAGKNTGL
jgi:Zn-finger nucleic acid-binding protein